MYLTYFLLGFILGGVWASCPPNEEIFPCICEEENLRLYCGNRENFTEDWDIKATFDRMTPLVPPDTVFDELTLSTTRLKAIPAEAIQTLKFRRIFIQECYSLKVIHPDAFGETANFTTTLSINTQFVLQTDTLFSVINKFKAATDIDLHNIIIKSIPDGGFGPLPNLRNITMNTNKLLHIGSRAFSQLPNLEYADLRYSEIELEAFAEDAFEGVGSNVDIQLGYNPFVRLPEVPFKPLLENAKQVTIGGENCYWLGFWYCVDIKLDCQEDSLWMCEHEEKYRSKLSGFLCFGQEYKDIWEYCVGQVNSTLAVF